MERPAPRHRNDFGRRLYTRREELGLTRAEVADRSGAVENYIEYLEEQGGSPGIGVTLRLAEALDTTVDELTGRTADEPPGRGSAPTGAALRVLDEDESRALLSQGGVGRVATDTPDGPVIAPVNYIVSNGEIFYRTALGAAPSSAGVREVCFEVDRIDDAFRRGWSVLVVGQGRFVTDAAEVRALEAAAPGLAWAGEDRPIWLAITPHRITGRRIINDLGPS
ncbi:pyridoxamine 5'-phosphate oxidase family protein [Streptomyces sp. NBC_00654]|uniref:helix-turn-helix domain-containing protein n=1 Tax=Streptomyces sp. NBC_00654 TaxID=2975799 RepID=UPI002259D21C|nr:pyridoxamine 5'-phosphate oxidase family protein [Streptomyces sp. NBC_00654]MCX4966118.1 pyridoxamine 5'-phosphate oxidase family protein [Streptomyces sp. NBC_00654]